MKPYRFCTALGYLQPGLVVMLVSTIVFLAAARINVGRIAALLAYCYRLCKTYIEKHLSVGGLMGFVMMVAGWLFRFLLKAKFYEWLDKQGGWVSVPVGCTHC